MPEALEKWPVKVMAKMLPRHMEIIEIINSGWIAYLETALAALPKAERTAKIDAMSIIHENQWNKDEMCAAWAGLPGLPAWPAWPGLAWL